MVSFKAFILKAQVQKLDKLYSYSGCLPHPARLKCLFDLGRPEQVISIGACTGCAGWAHPNHLVHISIITLCVGR